MLHKGITVEITLIMCVDLFFFFLNCTLTEIQCVVK